MDCPDRETFAVFPEQIIFSWYTLVQLHIYEAEDMFSANGKQGTFTPSSVVELTA